MPEPVTLLACAIEGNRNKILAGEQLVLVLSPYLAKWPQLIVTEGQNIVYARDDRGALIAMIMAANVGQSVFNFQLQEMSTSEHGDARPSSASTKRSNCPGGSTLEDDELVYKNAAETAETGHNVLLVGPPGVGRTRLLLTICYKLRANGKRVIVLSATQSGLAGFDACGAANPAPDDAPDIQPELMTSALGLWMFDRYSETTALNRLKKWNKRARDNWTLHDVIAIDNIAATSAETMNRIIYLSRMLRTPPPQFILAGNFTGGRPVVYNKTTDKFEQVRYAIHASSFSSLNVRLLNLRIPYRQDPDPMLGDIIRRLAHNEPLTDEQAAALRSTVHERKDQLGRVMSPGRRPDDTYTHLFLTSDHANDYNKTKHAAMVAAGALDHTYVATLDHVVLRHKDSPAQRLHLPDLDTLKFQYIDSPAAIKNAQVAITDTHTFLEYSLCVGSRVMLTRTMHSGMRFTAGIQGVVVGFDVAGMPRVRFQNDLEIVVPPVTFTGMDNNCVFEVVLKQVPLTLAWALTISVSVGITLPKVMAHLGRAYGFGHHGNGKALEAIGRVQSLSDLIIGTETTVRTRAGGVTTTHEDLDMDIFRVDPEILHYFDPYAESAAAADGVNIAEIEAALGKIQWIRDADPTQRNGAANRYSWIASSSIIAGRKINMSESSPDVIKQALNGRPSLRAFSEVYEGYIRERKRKVMDDTRKTTARIRDQARKRHETMRDELIRQGDDILLNDI